MIFFCDMLVVKKGKLKKECLGGRKEFLPWIFSWGELTMFLVKKKDFKIKYGFEGLIPNVDLDLFHPNNQLMFSVVTHWFC